MVWPILISVSVTPGALSARAGQQLVVKAAAAAALDCRNTRRVVMKLLPFPFREGGALAPGILRARGGLFKHGPRGRTPATGQGLRPRRRRAPPPSAISAIRHRSPRAKPSRFRRNRP